MAYIKILGSRGSVAVSGEQFQKYGHGTSCVVVDAGKDMIFLDAGSGITGADAPAGKDIHILISHPHLDHITGLPFFKPLSDPLRRVNIFLKDRGVSPRELIDGLFTPPYWPLGISDYPAETVFSDVPESFCAGSVKVSTMEGNHPGGSTVFALDVGGKKIVYCSDYEHCERLNESLTEFAAGAQYLIYDGQYTGEEYTEKKGYGHSTPREGIELARRAGVEHLIITHHDPYRDDETLSQIEREAVSEYDGLVFAKAGDIYQI